MRFITAINTGASTSDLILGYASGAQVLRWSAQPANTVILAPVWAIWETGDVMQWQISASSWQLGLFGQLLTIV